MTHRYLPKPHRTIRSLDLYCSRPILRWTTVWPFLLLYIANTIFFFHPTLVVSEAFAATWERYLYYGTLMAFPALAFVNIFVGLLTVWSVNLRAKLRFTKTQDVHIATHVLVTTHENRGGSSLVPLIDEKGCFCFHFQNRRWQWDEARAVFTKPIFPSKWPMHKYLQITGQAGEVRQLLHTFGPNKFTVQIPEFWTLFAEHAMAPFFMFQMLCVVLWLLDEYWIYSVFTGIMLVVFEGTVVLQRLKSMSLLRQMSEVPPSKITCLRDKLWVKLSSTELVPGDVIVVNHTPAGVFMACDCVILQGTAVVTESLLTGESTPQMKESIAMRGPEELFHLRKDVHHVVYGGTSVLTASREAPPEGIKPSWPDAPPGAIAFVIKTGFETQQGKLIRTIVHSQSHQSANNMEALLFILFLLIFAIVACVYTIKRALEDPSRSRWKLTLTVIRILTCVVPPELPIELSLAVNTSLRYLVKMRVYCTEPFRIPFAGKVNYCCFDKTGTLTCDSMVLDGVDEGLGTVQPGANAKEDTVSVLAACHSLVAYGKECVGDSMEKAAIAAVGWSLKDPDRVGDHRGKRSVTILMRHPFQAELKRMSVIVSKSTAGKEDRYVLTKGAPEAMRRCLRAVPTNYDSSYVAHATAGYRVLALATRKLDAAMDRTEVLRMQRAEVEKDLDFVGFALFSSPVKSDAKSSIAHLQESSHRVVMVTGDNELTAVAVARELGMLGPVAKEPCPILRLSHSTGLLTWEPEIAEGLPLCINGEAMAVKMAQDPTWLKGIAARVVVWARCTPDQKESVVLTLKGLGHHVLMAGDGTNDVAALKQAHVGVSILNAATPSGGSTEGDNLPMLPIPPMPEEVPAMGSSPMDRLRFRKMQEQRRNAIAYREKIIRMNEQRKAGKAIDEATEEFMGDSQGTPMTRLGDASIASPFTSKSSKVGAVCDIVRMGRCTLVATLQTYKILALNSLISAYSMSVLYSDGVKFGDTQMFIVGLVITMCFLFVSHATPLDRLSQERPFSKVFCPYVMLSTVLQIAVHLCVLFEAVRLVDSADASQRIEGMKTVDDPKFKPTLLNSIVFLMSTMMTVTTFGVNYRGQPFMTPLLQNKFLWYSLVLLTIAVFGFSLEVCPALNAYMEIVPMPSEMFKYNFIALLLVDVGAVYGIERTMLALFRDVGERRKL